MIIETDCTNWLDKISGLTVSDAIGYLKTLDQSKTLSAWLSGDTHGCEMCSALTWERNETAEELAQLREQRSKREINRLKASVTYYKKQAEYWKSAGDDAARCRYEKQADDLQRKLIAIIG